MRKKYCLKVLRTATTGAVVAFSTIADAADPNTVVVAQMDDFKDWDPAIAFSIEGNMTRSVYETLTKYNMPGSKELVSPGLAASWTSNDTSTEWTFKLRQGVKFHDGTPLNAAAVKTSIERTMALKQGAYYIWEGLTAIETPDDHTVVFKCAHPMAIPVIASAQYGSYIYSPEAAKKGTDWFNAGNDGGSGPYEVESWKKDTQTVLKKFSGYWGDTAEGGFDTAIFRVVREPSTQLQLLRRGEVDFIDSLPGGLAAVKDDPNIAVDLAPSFKSVHMLLNVQKPPTDNVNFRKALAYSMDYNAVVDGVYSGGGSTTSGPLPSVQWGHASGLEVPSFDLEKAKQFLEASGVPADQRTVTLTYPASSEAYRDAALVLQANAATIGINVELKPGPWGAIWDRQKRIETAENIIQVTVWPTYPTPSDILISIYRTEDPTVFNLGHYNNPDYDKVVREAVPLEAADPTKALAKYAEAQKILVDDAASIGVIDLKNFTPHRKDIVGYTYNPGYNGFSFGDYRRVK